MINWKAHPFLRLILPLIVGILLGDWLRLTPIWYLFALPFLFLPFFFRFVFFKVAFRLRGWYGLIVNLFFISLGFSLVTFYPEIHRANHFSNYLESDNYLIGIVSKPPTHKTRTNTILSIKRVIGNSNTTQGQLYVSFPDTANIQYGQLIALHLTPRLFSKASNPHAFNFQAWQYYQNVHYQAFAKENQWTILGYNQGNPLLTFAFHLRNRFQKVLHRIIPNPRDVGVASALVLGVKDDLSAETKEAFSSTGAMHVLAVSGLHVGIVSMGLRYLMLAIFGQAKARRWWRLLAQLAGVWFFVLLTGAGASVLRAGVMFSIIEVGLAMDRRASIFNSIAASAFILLIWNPFLIFQVGFQLSYLALSGIVFFQPHIYKLWVFESSIFDFIWKLCTVSLAAQLSTFPIGIYYFHQFPLSFFLSGIVVVPAATILLPFSILVFLIDFISSPVADFIGHGLAFLYHLNTEFIFRLSHFEWMKLNEIYFSKLTVLLSFALIGTIGVWIVSKHKRLIFFALGFLTLLTLERNVLKYQNANRSEICFFKTPKVDAIGFVSGTTMLHYHSDSLAQKKWFYATNGLIIRDGIIQDIALSEKNRFSQTDISTRKAGLTKTKNFWNYKGRIIEMVPPVLPSPRDFKTNIIYISENIDTNNLIHLNSDTIILGNQISRRDAKELTHFFLSRDVMVYNLREDGGFLISD